MTQPAKGILETILLVEDDPAILKMVKLILEGAGFGVLSATSANEASLIAEGFPRAIHLLLSDVMMPDVSGPELASALKENRPEMRVMLMSGFADGAMLILNPAQSRLALHCEAVSRFCLAREQTMCCVALCTSKVRTISIRDGSVSRRAYGKERICARRACGVG